MANGDTKTESYLRVAAEGTRADLPSDTCCNTKTQNLILGVANRIMDVEDEVEEMKNNPDVADIVATYADLQAYDKSKLTDKDVIRVLADETHNDDSTYYRYDKSTDAFTYIGESKQYTNFVGTDGVTAGTSGLVPAPATTDVDKFLKSDGTWDVAGGGGPTVLQTIGTSTTDVMSQKAVTDMVFDKNSTWRVRIGEGIVPSVSGSLVSIGGARLLSTDSIGIGNSATKASSESIAIGIDPFLLGTEANATGAVSIGSRAKANYNGSIAFGYFAKTNSIGEFNIGLPGASAVQASLYGYNGSQYRLLSGVYDGQNANDAVTVGQVNSVIDAINAALSTNIQHIGA